MSNTCKSFVQRVAGFACDCKPVVRIYKGGPKYRFINACLSCEARKTLATIARNAKRKRLARTKQFELPCLS